MITINQTGFCPSAGPNEDACETVISVKLSIFQTGNPHVIYSILYVCLVEGVCVCVYGGGGGGILETWSTMRAASC